MYINPETNIKLLKNVPLDNTYQHTIYFSSKSSQSSYFSGLTKYNLTGYTYQRVKRGVCRVGIKADSLYDCNYMMFQNSAYGSKWFYAFITSVEFVNNECSEISFELDVMQTWHFDYEPEYCFVEREHSVGDVIGAHIEPEPVELGEYTMNGYEQVLRMTDMVVCVAIVDVDGGADGTLYDGIYGGASLWVYDSTDADGINSKVNDYLESPDSVIGMYMFPKVFIGGKIPSNHRLTSSTSAMSTVVKLNPVKKGDDLDGYVPKNKKLYTYPYTFLHVDNASGSELNLRYELFNTGYPIVEISGTITQPVVAILRPADYKGVPAGSTLGGYTTLNTESIQLANYPLCSWSVDTYEAWVAQNALPIMAKGVGYMTGLALAPSPKLAGSVVKEAGSVMLQAYNASISADISKGSYNNGCVNVADNKQQFYYGRCSITRNYARCIDDYFTMFGYATNRLKVPNRNSRPHWNFVKTIGAVLSGSVPADDMKKLCDIYDKGVTFWKSGSEVGNYSLDNTVN